MSAEWLELARGLVRLAAAIVNALAHELELTEELRALELEELEALAELEELAALGLEELEE